MRAGLSNDRVVHITPPLDAGAEDAGRREYHVESKDSVYQAEGGAAMDLEDEGGELGCGCSPGGLPGKPGMPVKLCLYDLVPSRKEEAHGDAKLYIC